VYKEQATSLHHQSSHRNSQLWPEGVVSMRADRVLGQSVAAAPNSGSRSRSPATEGKRPRLQPYTCCAIAHQVARHPAGDVAIAQRQTRPSTLAAPADATPYTRAHQSPSEPIRAHQSPSEPLPPTPLPPAGTLSRRKCKEPTIGPVVAEPAVPAALRPARRCRHAVPWYRRPAGTR